jgi:hypothetical protein
MVVKTGWTEWECGTCQGERCTVCNNPLYQRLLRPMTTSAPPAPPDYCEFEQPFIKPEYNSASSDPQNAPLLYFCPMLACPYPDRKCHLHESQQYRLMI